MSSNSVREGTVVAVKRNGAMRRFVEISTMPTNSNLISGRKTRHLYERQPLSICI